jgi:hypothetical protein
MLLLRWRWEDGLRPAQAKVSETLSQKKQAESGGIQLYIILVRWEVEVEALWSEVISWQKCEST